MKQLRKTSMAFRGMASRLLRCGRLALAGMLAATVSLILALPVAGQSAQGAGVPGFWDPHRRIEKPDTGFVRVIRFVTDDAYPPFGFTAPDGTLTGFNVELARAICDELKAPCTIQARRFDTILEAIDKGEADAAIASIAISGETRKRADFTAPYYRTPARFLALKNSAPARMRPETLKGRTVGVVQSSAHEAYLKAFFPGASAKTYANLSTLLGALKSNEVNIVFADGVSLATWLAGPDAGICCEFRDGPFTESAYFGEGAGIAVKSGNAPLRHALNYALMRISERGVYADIYLKYFPVGFY